MVRGVLVALALLLGARAEAGPVIVLSSGLTTEDAAPTAPLLEALGEDALHGSALRRVLEARLSRGAGPREAPDTARSEVDEGRRLFLEGQFEDAIHRLEAVRAVLERHTTALVGDQDLRGALRRALLLLAHAYLRTGQRAFATERAGEVIRSFPDWDPSQLLLRFGPDLAKLYRDTQRELEGQPRGTLLVSTQTAGCMIYVNERFVGVSTARVKLLPGAYRVYLQDQKKRGRVHRVTVGGARAQASLEVDFELESALAEDGAGLRFEDTATMARREVPLAAAAGRALGASSVLLVGLRRHQGRRTLVGSVISPAGGRAVRSAMIIVEPTPPSTAVVHALARFLVAGDSSAAGLIVTPTQELAAAAAPSGSPPAAQEPGPGFFSARVFKWVTLGLAVGALGAGITLLALDGRGDCEGNRCPESFHTLTPGAVLTGVGGLAAVGSGVLFYLDARGARRERRALVYPLLQPRVAGAAALFRF